MRLDQTNPGARFTIDGDLDHSEFTRIGNEPLATPRGLFYAAIRHDGVPGYYPASLRVVPLGVLTAKAWHSR